MEFDLYIGEDGLVEHVYDDALADLFDGEGEVVTERASHVEPSSKLLARFTPLARQGWVADMSPVGGPLLLDGGQPFATRVEALAAERKWLDAQMQQREV